ncbi:MAG: alpha-L-fucosidase, partial [Bacteroidales bacterium]|nr:alpha-L-fucosidase [Bacteroidales bacterium]
MLINSCTDNKTATIPSYLKDFQEEYAENPRDANLKWFTGAKFGMFIHYGLYAQLAKGEWVQ